MGSVEDKVNFKESSVSDKSSLISLGYEKVGKNLVRIDVYDFEGVYSHSVTAKTIQRGSYNFYK